MLGCAGVSPEHRPHGVDSPVGETDPPLDSDSPDWAGPPLSLRRGLGGIGVKIIENHKGIATVSIAQNIQKN